MTNSRIISSLLFLLLPLMATAGSIFDLLYNGKDVPVALRLELPMDSILAKSNNEQTARVIFTDVNGQAQNWNLDVAIRGKFRRQFNFSKKELKAAGLDSWDKYKLVSTCSADPLAKNLVLKEYLAYRAYNMLSPWSFRVQWVEITFVDANGNHAPRVEAGFLIEETDEMAARIGGKELENPIGQPAAAFHPQAEVTQALMQYLVSNGDWSMPLARNVKVVEMPDGKLIPVGYDFDFSGWVGAPYASPTGDIGQQSIYQRIYQGYVQPDAIMREVATNFREHRREVLSLINNFYALPGEDRVVMYRFASRFFKELNDKNLENALPLYQQLRGDVAEVIPPGAEADSFRGMVK
jgi:hypothetical protein